MKKTLLIIFIVLIIAIFIFLYLGEGREDSLSLNLKDVPKTPINEICLEISHPDNINYCLAVVNQDISFCEKFKRRILLPGNSRFRAKASMLLRTQLSQRKI